MSDNAELKSAIKRMLVDNLMLKIAPEEIPDDQALFGPNSLGLDSVDALQIVVALEGAYGLKIPDPGKAKSILASVSAIADAVQSHLAAKPKV